MTSTSQPNTDSGYIPIPPRGPQTLPLNSSQDGLNSSDVGYTHVNLNIVVNTPQAAGESEYEQALPIRPQPRPRTMDPEELSSPTSGHVQYINVGEIPQESPPAYTQHYINRRQQHEKNDKSNKISEQTRNKAPLPLPRENKGYLNCARRYESTSGIYVEDVNVEEPNTYDVEEGYVSMGRP